MPLNVRGQQGMVRYGYLTAFTIRDWSLTREDGATEGVLNATVVSADTYRVSQHPLVFVVGVIGGSWRWPILTLQINGTSLSATVGPKE